MEVGEDGLPGGPGGHVNSCILGDGKMGNRGIEDNVTFLAETRVQGQGCKGPWNGGQ